jgi:hypothetical protein
MLKSCKLYLKIRQKPMEAPSKLVLKGIPTKEIWWTRMKMFILQNGLRVLMLIMKLLVRGSGALMLILKSFLVTIPKMGKLIIKSSIWRWMLLLRMCLISLMKS